MSKIPIIKVEEFITNPNLTPDKLFEGLKSRVIVRFYDGDIELSSREVVVNSYIWNIFKKLDKLKIGTKYCLSNYYTNGFYNADALTKVLNTIFKDVSDVYCKPTLNREILNTYLYEVFGQLYNDINDGVVHKSQQYITSVDYSDFMEIQTDEKILKAMVDVKKEQTDDSIDNAYKTITDVLNNDDRYKDNPLTLGARSGSFSARQLKQCLGPVGRRTDLDFSAFNIPIFSSFTTGLLSTYEQALESKTAARSLHTSSKAIRTAEYLAREIQLATMNIEKVLDGDCGSTDYIELTIQKDGITGKDELPLYLGKFYLNEETGELEEITREHTHLYNKVIKLRSVLTCKCKSAKTICMRCFGMMSVNIPYSANIGHFASTYITSNISQSIMSDKHITESAKAIELSLDEEKAKWFAIKGKNSIGFRLESLLKNSNKYRYELVLPQHTCRGLFGHTSNIKLDKVIPSSISKLDEIWIEIYDKKTDNFVNMEKFELAQSKTKNKKVSNKKSKIYGYFTTDFLMYIVNDGNYRYRVGGEDDRLYIDLSHWKSDKAIIEYPSIEYNFQELARELKTLMRGASNGSRPEDKSVTALLQHLFNVLNVKLDVNIALIEILIASLVIKSREKTDYHLAKANNGVIDKLASVIHKGSLSGNALYEHHNTYLFSVETFREHPIVPDHKLDVLFKPQEVIQDVIDGKRT